MKVKKWVALLLAGTMALSAAGCGGTKDTASSSADESRVTAVSYTHLDVYKRQPNGLDYNGNPLPEWDAYRKEKKAVMRFTDQAAPGVLEECPVLDYRLEYGKSKLTD